MGSISQQEQFQIEQLQRKIAVLEAENRRLMAHRFEGEILNRYKAERRLLGICQTCSSIYELMQKVAAFFQELSGCRAIGIRLADRDDFPYYTTTGFPERFVRLESSLCSYDRDGNIQRDLLGNPVLECMCGNVLRGRFDPRLPFFTGKGSFWTNSTSKLLAATTEADLQGKTRNSCPCEGYESVALIPIRMGDVCHGLVQLNDYACDRFTLEQIVTLEQLADHLGLAVTKLMADERLRVSEEHYRLIFDNSLEAIVIARDGKIVKANRAHEELTGYSEEEIIHKEFSGWIHPDDRAMVGENHRRRLAGERVECRYAFRLICKSGRIKWVEQHGSVIDWEGKPATLNFLIDISTQRGAEDALRRHKEAQQAILDASPDAICLIDRDGILQMCNEAMRVKWKLRVRKLTGRSVYELFPPQVVINRKERNQQVIDSGLPGCVEYELDGSMFQTNIRPVFDEQGKVSQLAVFATDITERKKNEELLKASLRLSEAVDRLDIAGLLTMALDEAEKLTGSCIGFFHFLAPDGETILLQAWSTMTSKQFCQADGSGLHYDLAKAGVWADAIRQGKPVIHNEYVKLEGRKGIPLGHAEVQRELVVPVVRGGAIVAVLGVGNKVTPYDHRDVELVQNLANLSWDIVLRKRAEVVLRKSLAEKEVLIREVHHRVKNNLAAVTGLFELHRKNIADPKAAEILRELSGRVRAMSLVHEKLYRSENLAAIRMHDYLDALISHLRTSMGRREITCHITHNDQELPLDLAVPCGMIVNELVTNALKYAFPPEMIEGWNTADTPVIEITIEPQGVDRMRLSVTDNGLGLPADFDLRRINTLGMVLVRMLGEHQLGGTYSVCSENGVQFRLDFPLSQKGTGDA